MVAGNGNRLHESVFGVVFLFCFSFRFHFLWGMEGGLIQYSYSESTLQKTRPARIVVRLDSRLGGERPFRIPLPSQRPRPAFKSESSPFSALIFFCFCSSFPCLLSRMARRYNDTMLQSCEGRGRGRERPAPSSCCSVPCVSSNRLNPRGPLSSRISHPSPGNPHRCMCIFIAYSAVWDRHDRRRHDMRTSRDASIHVPGPSSHALHVWT